jgi:rhomboid protease GluP
MTLIALAVLSAFAIYIMKPEERARAVRRVLALAGRVAGAVTHRAGRHAKKDSFVEALRTRADRPFVAPAVITLNVLVFVGMLFWANALSDPQTLILWGGNFGPRTTNVEWGRMFDSMFIHVGPLHLLATIAGLVQAGLLVERLAGHLTFSVVYLMSGFFASVISLRLYPLDVSVGASGAIFGLYGFLVAMLIRGRRRPAGLAIPARTLKTLAPAAALFAVYNVFGGELQLTAELAGLTIGVVSGLVLSQEIAERKPAPRRVLATGAATFLVAAAMAIPLHGMTDVRPEIEWIVRLEKGTAARYHVAVERFRKGVISASELADVINRKIIPEFQSARARLSALGRIPREHEVLVATADRFLRLRDESWRLRAEALGNGNMAKLRQADQIESTSLATLESLRPAIRQ